MDATARRWSIWPPSRSLRRPQWKPELQPDAGEQPLSSALPQRLRERPSASAVDQHGRPAGD